MVYTSIEEQGCRIVRKSTVYHPNSRINGQPSFFPFFIIFSVSEQVRKVNELFELKEDGIVKFASGDRSVDLFLPRGL